MRTLDGSNPWYVSVSSSTRVVPILLPMMDSTTPTEEEAWGLLGGVDFLEMALVAGVLVTVEHLVTGAGEC